MNFIYNTGNPPPNAGNHTTNCVVRAIAIVTQLPYTDIQKALLSFAKRYERTGKRKKFISSRRHGIYRVTYDRYLRSLGFTFHPCLSIGSKQRTRFLHCDLPLGRILVCTTVGSSGHMTAVIDHTIHDTADRACTYTRDGFCIPRTVHGYYTPPTTVHLTRHFTTPLPPAFVTADFSPAGQVLKLPPHITD